MCLHVTGGAQWQIQQAYMLLTETLTVVSRTLIQYLRTFSIWQAISFSKETSQFLNSPPVINAFLEDLYVQV
jgi:hypothetical protein